MKKSVCLLWALVCLPAWPLDWELPIFTMRYEVAGGRSEDPDDDTLEPTSLRNTVSLAVKEEADPATFGLLVAVSAKDYYQQTGDYSYLRVEQDGAVRLDDSWKIGYLLGVKWMEYGQADARGLSKDALSLKAGGNATLHLSRLTSLEAGVAGRFSFTQNAADAAQALIATAGLSTRLDQWLLGARYRGEMRFPLGGASDAGRNALHTGAISLQWNPNR